jgi:hypothetical protein
MGDPTVLKGVYKDGAVVASVVQQDDQAKIMVKGIEPTRAGDNDFAAAVKKVADGCREHIEKFAERELCAVLVTDPSQAENIAFTPEEMASFGLTKVTAMDGTCGIVTRVVENEPAPIPLPYTSLRSSSGLPNQPGMVDVPGNLPRKMHKDLTDPQKKVYEAAAQVAGRGTLKMVCLLDGEIKLAIAVKDAPPPRARSVLVPLQEFAADLAKGVSYEEIAKRMGLLRT